METSLCQTMTIIRALVLNIAFVSSICTCAMGTGTQSSDSRSSNESESKGTNIFAYYKSGDSLPFTVGISSGQGVYNWSTLAVKIIGMQVDGQQVPAAARGISMNRFDASTSNVAADSIIYMSSPGIVASVEDYDPISGRYEANLYNIPKEFKTMVITYVVRFPSGKMSEESILRLHQSM